MNADVLKEAVAKCPQLIVPPFDSIIGKLGFEGLCVLADEFGGCQIYVPSKRYMFKECLISAVRNEFNGANHKTLAKKYDFSTEGVRKFLKK